MVQDHIWSLIAKKLSGEGNEEDFGELEQLLRENPELHYSLQAITDLWFSDFQFDQHEAQEAFKRHIERMQEFKMDFRYQQEEEASASKTVLRKNRMILWPALAVAVIVGSLFFGSRFFGSNIPPSLTVTRGVE